MVGAEVGEALTSIVRSIGRYECEARLFAYHSRVTEAIANLFAQILSYLVQAKLHFTKSKFVRAAKAAFGHNLNSLYLGIEKRTIFLDREIRTASEERKDSDSIIITQS